MVVVEVDVLCVIVWCEVIEDLSGIEFGEWMLVIELLLMLKGLFEEVGCVYVFFLFGNNVVFEV